MPTYAGLGFNTHVSYICKCNISKISAGRQVCNSIYLSVCFKSMYNRTYFIAHVLFHFDTLILLLYLSEMKK